MLTAAGYARASKTSTERQHNDHVQAPCEHFGSCGGCALQDLAYAKQLQHKDQQITDALSRTGQGAALARSLPARRPRWQSSRLCCFPTGKQRHAGAVHREPIPAEAHFHYRNKVRRPVP